MESSPSKCRYEWLLSYAARFYSNWNNCKRSQRVSQGPFTCAKQPKLKTEQFRKQFSICVLTYVTGVLLIILWWWCWWWRCWWWRVGFRVCGLPSVAQHCRLVPQLTSTKKVALVWFWRPQQQLVFRGVCLCECSRWRVARSRLVVDMVLSLLSWMAFLFKCPIPVCNELTSDIWKHCFTHQLASLHKCFCIFWRVDVFIIY